MNTFVRAAAATAALLAAGLPAAGSAANMTQPMHYSFETQLTQRYHAGGFAGSLSMTVRPDGTVTGWYTPIDGNPRNVVGGVDGTRIWLDIGGIRNLHLVGTLRDGVLHAAENTPGSDPLELNSVGQTR